MGGAIMETAKLYYEDSRLREFDARVLELSLIHI